MIWPCILWPVAAFSALSPSSFCLFEDRGNAALQIAPSDGFCEAPSREAAKRFVKQGLEPPMEGQNLKIVEQARDEIIKLLADKRHEHSLYMQRCKGITASIKDWKDKAK
jgi:hypothetical protein